MVVVSNTSPILALSVQAERQKDGKIDSLKTVIESLRNEVGFYITNDLEHDILKQADEI